MARKLQKKHFKSLAVIAAVTTLVIISSTMAYFSSKDNTTNKFVGSRFDVMLLETDWDPEKAQNVIPGEELDKNPQIVNIERTPCYVFMRVTVPCDTQMVDKDDGTPMSEATDARVPMYKFMVAQGTDPETYLADTTFSPKQLVHDHWQLIHDEGKDYTEYKAAEQEYVYVYAYSENNIPTLMERNDITVPLFDKIQLWNFNEKFDQTKSHDVRVEALGVQTDIPASDIDGAWAILKGEVDG